MHLVLQGIMAKRPSGQIRCSASESSSSESEQSGSESSSNESEQSGSENSSSESEQSDSESLDDSPYIMVDPPATWYPPGSLPATTPNHGSEGALAFSFTSICLLECGKH